MRLMWTFSAAAPACSKANWASLSQLLPGARRISTLGRCMMGSYFGEGGPSRRRAAVDDEHLARHERRFVRRQVQRGVRDLFRLADARDRLRRLQPGHVLLVLPEVAAEVGLDQPRRQGVDADAVRAELARPRARQHQEARLGEAVKQPARLRLEA